MRWIILPFCVFSFLVLQAQNAGKIEFVEKMDLHKNLPPEREHLKNMMPQFSESRYEFYFTEEESMYMPKKEIEDPAYSPGSNQMRYRWNRDTRVVYKNLGENRIVDSRDFLQKQFLIKGNILPKKWKITSKQKSILGYMCLSATYQADSVTNIVAWFAPQLAVQNGPADYQGLPGMILSIDINDGHRIIEAVSIDTTLPDPEILKEPKKGKEVTPEEFEKIQEEKFKEMGLQNGGPPRHMFIYR